MERLRFLSWRDVERVSMEDGNLQQALDLAELRRRNTEADRHEEEANAVRNRLWPEAAKWAVAAAGLHRGRLNKFFGG